jgi:outer membrane biosynthesis protein TonB
MTMPATTVNDDSLKNSLVISAVVHLVLLLAVIIGLPHLMPPLPEHHAPVPFEIVQMADITNTRVKEEPQPETKPPQPPPPPPQTHPEQVAPPPPQPVKPPEPQAEALKAAPVPKPKPQPPETKPQNDEFSKLLKNLENTKKTEAPKVTESKPDSKAPAQPVAQQTSSLSERLTISEEDALRRQIEGCWNPDPGARDAQNMIVDVVIDMNPDRTVLNAEVVDKSRYASDGFFRAAADRAIRAVRNPRCSPLEVPADKYGQWKRITFTFDPRDLL